MRRATALVGWLARIGMPMKLTRSVGHAVGVLLRVAQGNGGDDGPMTAADIAAGCDFPPRFLYRILRRLVDAGLINGVPGPGGGYSLARNPREITLLDIVQAVDGPVSGVVLEPVHRKMKRALDTINAACARNAEVFSRELGRLSLAKLAEAS